MTRLPWYYVPMIQIPTIRAGETSPRVATGSGFLRWGLVLGLAGTLAVTGCSIFTGSREPAWGITAEDAGRITLEVFNDNYNDARIFARWNGERQRLGFVTGNSSERFEMSGRVGTLRLEVDFVAGGSFLSDPVQVGPGESLTFRIPPRR